MSPWGLIVWAAALAVAIVVVAVAVSVARGIYLGAKASLTKDADS